MPYIQLYLKDDSQRKAMYDLAQKLHNDGIKMDSGNGKLSVSPMVRYLVEKELERPRAELEQRIQCLEILCRDVLKLTQTELVDLNHAQMILDAIAELVHGYDILDTIAAKARAVMLGEDE